MNSAAHVSSCATPGEQTSPGALKTPLQLALEQAQTALTRVFQVPGLSTQKRYEHARGINRGMRRLEFQNGITHVASFPGQLELPVAGKCNLRCEMCALTHGAPMYPNWTYAEVERFLPLIRYADAVNPTGAGEPLLVKDFFQMLALFRANENVVGFYTNATQLTPERIDRLIELNVNAVNISIDGATAETFERIRHPAKFDVVVGNARKLIARRNQLGALYPRLQIAMVLMRDNMHEFDALVRLAADIGADRVYTMFVSETLPDQMCEREPARTNQVLREAKETAKSLGIHFFAPAPLPEKHATQEERVTPAIPQGGIRCSHPWNQYVVWNDGEVSPCCRIRDHVDGQRFGNIREDSPEKLWNSPGFVRLRERLSTGCPPEACVRCPLRTATIS